MSGGFAPLEGALASAAGVIHDTVGVASRDVAFVIYRVNCLLRRGKSSLAIAK